MKTISSVVLAGILGIAGAAQSFAQMSVTNGASFDPSQPIAAGSFATIFGQNLCSQAMVADWIAPDRLPTALGGCSVAVGGAPAMMQYISPTQINFIMPRSVASGTSTITVQNGSQMSMGSVIIGASGPGMFSLNGMGIGEGAMLNGTMWKMGPFSTTTNGQPTYVSMYVTGLDMSMAPTVAVGGIPVDVVWFGSAPGYAGLQQINVQLPSGMAGVGRVPVTVMSNGQVSNITFMHVLPNEAMMQGMPGWGPGMTVVENMARGRELSSMAFNSANNTALVTDEEHDVVRVISLGTNSTVATITLPNESQAHFIAINATGTMAAVALSAKASIGLIDLSQNKLISTVGTGYYPSHLAFSGTNLLVTNAGSGSVSVIDTITRTVTQTVNTGLGASGIAVVGNTAVVANMQAGSISILNLSTFAVSTLPLPAGSRPRQIASSTSANKVVITTPMTNGFLILDLGASTFKQVGTSTWNGMGPSAVALNGNTVYIANQMTASVTVADLVSATVVKTFPVDPGPIALAVNIAKNQLLVLAQGTGTLDVVDLTSHGIIARINASDTEAQGRFTMPLISSISPGSALVGTTLTLQLLGSGFQGIQGLEFLLTGGAMMGGGSAGGQADANIKVSNLQVNSTGTQISASIQILPAAAIGTRQIRVQTSYGSAMGSNSTASFTVTK